MISSHYLVGESSKVEKTVHFPQDHQLATIALEIETIYELSGDAKREVWFSRSDYHFTRSSARVIAKESERYGHSKHLDNVYITSFDQEVQNKLNLWTLHGSSGRGLERWANTTHGDVRKNDQYLHVQAVIRAQTEMKLEGEDFTKQAERLSEVSMMLSQKAKLYAQMLGSADEDAAKWELGINEAPLVRPSSPRQILKEAKKEQASVRNLGLGGPKARQVAGRGTSVSNYRSTLPAFRRSVPTAASASVSIEQTRPARVPRIA